MRKTELISEVRELLQPAFYECVCSGKKEHDENCPRSFRSYLAEPEASASVLLARMDAYNSKNQEACFCDFRTPSEIYSPANYENHYPSCLIYIAGLISEHLRLDANTRELLAESKKMKAIYEKMLADNPDDLSAKISLASVNAHIEQMEKNYEI